MLTSSWRAALEAALSRVNAEPAARRIAVMGIGQELYGDDGAGCAVALRLSKALKGAEDVLVLDAGPVPETQTGALRRFGPHLVILVDAARMNTLPGEVRFIPLDQIEGMAFSSHTLPLDMVAKYLSATLDCEVCLIGIQSATMELGAGLTPPVQVATESLAAGLADILQTLAVPALAA